MGVGAGDVFQCLSTCYFGTPKFWALLKVAATLFREESDGDDTPPTEDDLLKIKKTHLTFKIEVLRQRRGCRATISGADLT